VIVMRRRLLAPFAVVAAVGSLGMCSATALAAHRPGASAGHRSKAGAGHKSKPSAGHKSKRTRHKAKPKPRPTVTATVSLASPDAYVIKGDRAVLPGHYVHVTGTVSKYVAGEAVVVKASLNKKVFHREVLKVKPGSSGTGTFTATVRARGTGILRVSAKHRAGKHVSAFSDVIGIASLSSEVQYGSKGLFVDLVQRKLAALHFYIPQTGVWDSGTEWAVNAYHRLLDRGYSTTLDPGTLKDLMAGKGRFKVRYPNQGRHAEGDLGKQVLALIDGSKVVWIFPISSGKPSTPTILGSYRIYQRVPGFLPDGMYYSDFFIRGYAIHGYDPSPDFPASHGCMRLPIQDAIPAFNWLALGDWVDAYRDTGNYPGTLARTL